MSLVRLSSLALGALVFSACAHGASTASRCGTTSPGRTSAQRFVVLADSSKAAPTQANSCAVSCDFFASSPHPWCPSAEPPWAP